MPEGLGVGQELDDLGLHRGCNRRKLLVKRGNSLEQTKRLLDQRSKGFLGTSGFSGLQGGAPRAIRTPDLQIRRL